MICQPSPRRRRSGHERAPEPATPQDVAVVRARGSKGIAPVRPGCCMHVRKLATSSIGDTRRIHHDEHRTRMTRTLDGGRAMSTPKRNENTSVPDDAKAFIQPHKPAQRNTPPKSL